MEAKIFMKKLLALALALVLLTACGQKDTGKVEESDIGTGEVQEEVQVVNDEEKEDGLGDYISLEDADIEDLGTRIKVYGLNHIYYEVVPYTIGLDKVYLEERDKYEVDSFIEDYNKKYSFSPLRLEDYDLSENRELALLEYSIKAGSIEDAKKVNEFKLPDFKVSYEDGRPLSIEDRIILIKTSSEDEDTINFKKLISIDKTAGAYSFVTTLRLEDGSEKDVYYKITEGPSR